MLTFDSFIQPTVVDGSHFTVHTRGNSSLCCCLPLQLNQSWWLFEPTYQRIELKLEGKLSQINNNNKKETIKSDDVICPVWKFDNFKIIKKKQFLELIFACDYGERNQNLVCWINTEYKVF